MSPSCRQWLVSSRRGGHTSHFNVEEENIADYDFDAYEKCEVLLSSDARAPVAAVTLLRGHGGGGVDLPAAGVHQVAAGRALLITVSYLAAAVPGVDGEAALELRERRRARVAGVGPAHLPPDGRGVRPQLATCAPVSNTAVSRR